MPSHEVLGGLVQVYKRADTRYWWCRASVAHAQHRISTEEEALADAKQFAEDWFLGLRGQARAGLLKKPEKTFREAADVFTAEYGIITEGQRSPKWVNGHQIRLRRHLNPFFGDMGVSEVNADTAQAYRVYRMTGRKPGEEAIPTEEAAPPHKAPSRSTLHDEIGTLRLVMQAALRKGWISHVPNFSPPYKTSGKIAHRPWFSPDEYKKLYEATRQYAHDLKGEHHEWNAAQVHDYVLIMANTGLRPDEAMQHNLQHRDVTIVKDHATGERILEIDVRGKRGVGYCKSMPSAVRPYERLLRRAKPATKSEIEEAKRNGTELKPKYPEPTDPVFPGNHIKLFNGILRRTKLKLDREGNKRTAYSLRHTYICMRLMEGADIYQIAKNCRTSVEMIQKFYAAHIKNLLDAASINVMRPRAARQPIIVDKETDGDQPEKSKRNRTRKTRRQDGTNHETQA